MRNLIITADDFGNSIPINEAVEEGYNAGIISSASLMVAGDACADAVSRTSKFKKLGVGLHITLLDGKPILPPDLLPNLVCSNGKFLNDPIRVGINLYFSKKMQKQAEMEIEAQFSKFLSLGIELDHVNSHKHFHMHPKIVKILGKILPRYGNPSIRVPFEPCLKRPDLRFLDIISRHLMSYFLKLQNKPLNKIIDKLGIFANDRIFGLFDTGQMDEDKFMHFLNNLPDGVTELYLHPATRKIDGQEKLPKYYQILKERQTITSSKVKELLLSNNIIPMSYSATRLKLKRT